MNFVAYGVSVTSPETLPVNLPENGDADHSVKLVFSKYQATNDEMFQFAAPTVNMHDRAITLSSNLPVNEDRRATKRHWKIAVSNLFSFTWSNQGDSIQINSKQNPDMKLVAFWLLHTVIPAYLMLKETSFFLHASSVVVDNQAVLFIAPTHGGKSTMVDYFIRQGFHFLSDDKTRLAPGADEYTVFPSHPYRRPFREFEVLGKYSENLARRSLPVNSLFALNLVDPGDDFRVTKTAGLEKFELLKEAFLYEPVSLTEWEIKKVLKMAQLCQVYRAEIPRGIERLPEACEMILDHVREQA